MNRTKVAAIGAAALLCAVLAGCESKVKADASIEAPPPAKVEPETDANLLKVDHPEQFPLAAAERYVAAPELSATGVVNPDVSRNVPVISLATGRVEQVEARLGDRVEKGQLLMRIHSSDISGAFSEYRKAVTNEALASSQLERAKPKPRKPCRALCIAKGVTEPQSPRERAQA